MSIKTERFGKKFEFIFPNVEEKVQLRINDSSKLQVYLQKVIEYLESPEDERHKKAKRLVLSFNNVYEYPQSTQLENRFVKGVPTDEDYILLNNLIQASGLEINNNGEA